MRPLCAMLINAYRTANVIRLRFPFQLWGYHDQPSSFRFAFFDIRARRRRLDASDLSGFRGAKLFDTNRSGVRRVPCRRLWTAVDPLWPQFQIERLYPDGRRKSRVAAGDDVAIVFHQHAGVAKSPSGIGVWSEQ